MAIVLEQLAPEPVVVQLETTLPLGCGFGVSGAAALSTALSLGKFFKSKKTKEELVAVAREADIQAGTGVGDVPAQVHGGVVYRRAFEGPVDATLMDIPPKQLFCTVFGPIETKKVLSDGSVMEKVNRAGEGALTRFNEGKTLHWDELFEISWQFSKTSGLVTPEVKRTVERIQEKGGKGFMIMLGNAVLSTVAVSEKSWQTTLDTQGARLL
ncbi:MAG: hypothetical protein Q7S00_06115 [bacterium]|nr:hypothetical protein [bacterium]